ncbi:PAN2-PAN3 deadenylation complex catalytic subunit PAN2 isoform X1 [Diorhabda sublineata]|uniref:PAN2-PAN3 deadenylation complex catalytic subunit PAN2 isoform X1 n=1 Tax=Diorhabda sublineata TaxID=1163346 RepID=UPI0024E078DD|nr:PAN2-PAN3 deadenylation complex catalytic subunit PAN2 isoform X1 [Diorhabda sublineata]
MYFDNTGLAVVGQPENPGLVGMEEDYVQTHCILADGGDRFGVSALTFDKQEELLWMGNQGGHVTSYIAPGFSKYTSFQIHATEEVRQILTLDDGILVLTASTLRYQIRRGIPVYTHTSQNMNEMQCILQMSPSRFLLGSHREKLIDFNLSVGKETVVTEVGEGCVMLRPHSRFICAGNPLGRIDLRDPNSLNVEHSIDTHTGSLSDFDVQGNLLVTCGFSNRHNAMAVDRFLMVYDLRMLRAVSPMQTVIDPFFLKFVPSISSRLAVVSVIGQIQLLDTIALAEPKLCLFQMENPGALCLTFDISSSSQIMACGDNAGHIHAFSSSNSSVSVINTYSRPCEMPDTPTVYPSFSIDDYNTPLSIIPMPIVPPEIPLASDWPLHLTQRVYRKPVGIDPEIISTMKMQGPIGYAPNPKTSRRNQVPYDFGQNGYSHNMSHINRSPKHNEDNSNFIAIPKRYRKVDVKYNKMGTDDFQFDHYNKTGFSGLEATLPNSYCNGMLQVLYFIEPLRAVLLSHSCTKEFCLSCELGFLFHMLSTSSQNQPCQPGNFLRAFRTVPEASALSLILSDLHPDAKQKMELSALIQSWNRFILHQMHVELIETKKKNEDRKVSRKPFIYKETDFPSISGEKIKEKKTAAEDIDAKLEDEKREDISEISQLFGTKQLQLNCCLKCNNEVRKESFLLACNLVYPSFPCGQDEWSFCDILKRSLCPKQTTPAWCENCSKFTPTSQSRVLQSLPSILSINTGLHNVQHKQFWQTQMDKVVAKVSNLDVNNRASTPTAVLGSSKPCRYGDHCSRPGCRFRHSFDNAVPVPPSKNPYCSNNWLPHKVQLVLKEDELEITKIESDKEEVSASEDIHNMKKYELSAVVCYINDQSTSEKRNLVALIRVPDSYFKDRDKESDQTWYLFNDFSISPVSSHEATWFSLDWKIPCVLFYTCNDGVGNTPEVKQKLLRDVLLEDTSLAVTGGSRGISFSPLQDNEILKPGDLVAMDAEFVTLNQEEAEIRSDGKMSTIKPSQMSVARITCIRGSGQLEYTPFIDDYISTQEQVVDYLTKFSGIKPGDLDANFSSKHLTTLKSTYKKLRYLIDIGVIFVGHGLKNDFRVINLVVPPEQIVDTVQLFHLPHHRMVSLRFLAWHFLGMKIQSETHDSIEDARAALQLYKKYKQLEEQKKVGDALAELYETGKLLNWKVPED